MRVLVSAETKHGSTGEIAQTIAEELASAGHDVENIEPLQVKSLEDYDAVVLGSAVYMGRWMPTVKQFVMRHKDALQARPVWLFSSGPIGDPPKPEEDTAASEFIAETGAREHKVFAGKLDKGRLGLAERLVVKAVHAQEGDFRDWEEIRAWARDIARQLTGTVRAKPA
jgi:menaquinone-dependent protoporphyrinogen oxidase